ncbi:MAG: class I SAM-dependent methyltransferase [Thermostichales cyanobacterium BF4_bins_65]
MLTVTLRPGREKSLLRHHPWIFSGAIANVSGSPAPGETVAIHDHQGSLLGWGAFSPVSQIRVRLWSREREARLDRDWWRQQLQQVMGRRQALGQEDVTQYRLVNAEGDGLPGLVVDRYGEWLVCQFLSAGAEFHKRVILEVLAELCPCAGIYERSDGEVRAKEGLPPVTGTCWGKEPPALVVGREYGCEFAVDVRQGHKTGFYLDQRLNRRLLAGYVEGAEVLNCFAYTGGFSVWAGKGGAKSIVQVEASGSALALAQQNLERNGIQGVTSIEGDVFQVLRQFRQEQRQFDVIVLDPPKFADHQGQVERACRGYKDINWLGFRLLRPGGLLMTFSCSGLVSGDLFQKVVAAACVDAQRQAVIEQRLTQAPDHTVALHFPEGEYLKGLLCRVI